MEALHRRSDVPTIDRAMTESAKRGPRDYWESVFSKAGDEGRRMFSVGHSSLVVTYARDHLPHQADVVVLGCGGGRNATHLAGLGHRVVALDLAHSALRMVEVTRDESVRAPLLVQADAAALPFPDESFDGALCLYVLDHLPSTAAKRAVAEMIRCLRPGAHALLAFDEPDDGDGDGGPARRGPDGTLHYERGSCEGLLFRPMTGSDIQALLAPVARLTVQRRHGGGHVALLKRR